MHGEISNLWRLQKTSSEQFPALCVRLARLICCYCFPSCFSCEVEDEEEMALTTGWNSPDRPLCLLLPKMSKRTVLSAFLRLTRSSAWARVSDSRTDCFSEFHWRPKPECDEICSCGSFVAYKTLYYSIIVLWKCHLNVKIYTFNMERQLGISRTIPTECFNTLCAAVIAPFFIKYNS